jgi:L-malate glycosyltransferase
MDQKHIVHVFHGFRVGGSEVRTCQIINGLGDRYRHTIVALNDDFTAAALIEKQDNVTLLHSPGFAERSFLANAVVARRWLKRLRPNLLIAYSWGGFEWLVGNSVRKVCPDVFSIEGFITDEADVELPRRRIVRRIFASRCTGLQACSLRLENLAMTSWRVRPDKVVYIPNGIDLQRFTPRPPGGSPGRVVLGIVASLTSVKNHLLLLDAFRRLPSGAAELHIVGDGPERGRLAAQAADYGLTANVRFVGHQAEPAALLRAFDIFCLSSRSEQMPIAVLEAMATALPVVSTDVGDVRQMVCEGNRRFVVPLDNPAAYAAALGELIADAGLRGLLGSQNRRRCEEEFGFPLMLRRHEELYDRCMGA